MNNEYFDLELSVRQPGKPPKKIGVHAVLPKQLGGQEFDNLNTQLTARDVYDMVVNMSLGVLRRLVHSGQLEVGQWEAEDWQLKAQIEVPFPSPLDEAVWSQEGGGPRMYGVQAEEK